MRDGEQRVTGGRAAVLPVGVPNARPDRQETRALLCRGADVVEELLLGGAPPAEAAGGPGPQLTSHLLEELRATTARLVDLDRRAGAPRVLRDAERHARTLTALLAQTSEHSRLRPRLLVATGEAALLNARLARDQDELEVGGRWARLATALAHLGGVADLAAAAVSVQATFLLSQDDHAGTLTVLRQLDVMPPSARGQAYAQGWAAVAHAIAGRSYETMAALDRAEAALDHSARQPPSWWIPLSPATGMVCAEARSFRRLGKPERAYEVLERARAQWPTTLHRGSGELLIDLAGTNLEVGEVELACEHARTALEVARSTGSAKQLRMLATLARRMEAVPANPVTAEFRAQLGFVPTG